VDHSETVVTATESGTRIERRSRSYRTEQDALFATILLRKKGGWSQREFLGKSGMRE